MRLSRKNKKLFPEKLTNDKTYSFSILKNKEKTKEKK
jgi:hypothetical protein